MLNQDRFKTPKERIKAFHAWCGNRNCNSCTFSEMCGGCDERTVGIDVMAHWLALEAEEEKPEPCPFCGGECGVYDFDGRIYVYCRADGCKYSSGLYKTEADAIAAHNRVCRAVKAAKESEVAE